jgi:hypothetical protein
MRLNLTVSAKAVLPNCKTKARFKTKTVYRICRNPTDLTFIAYSKHHDNGRKRKSGYLCRDRLLKQYASAIETGSAI